MFLRKWLFPAAINACIVYAIAGCGDNNEKNIQPDSGAAGSIPITVIFKGDTTTVDLAVLPAVRFSNPEAVCLVDIVDTATVTEPGNYVYRICGSDGYRAHAGGLPDNTWSQLPKGYVVRSDRSVLFDTSLALDKGYFVKDFTWLEVLRKVDFSANGTVTQFVVPDIRPVPFKGKDSVKMTSLFPDSPVNPEAKTYQLISADGVARSLAWDQFSQAYYVIPDDEVQYEDASLTGLNMKKLMIVIVTP